MTEISGIDRVVLLLRQRLEARERARKKQGTQIGVSGANGQAVGVEALLQTAGADDKVLRRAFVQSLLSEHFGPQLLNEASFQQIVDQVSQTIADDPVAEQLLARLMNELRHRASRNASNSPS